MKQILHIFVKDARHQWLEILVSLAVTVALVFTCRSRWHTGAMLHGSAVSFSTFELLGDLPALLVLIVPLSWWLLISPVIHEEKLVGDRQFWITRPYEWKKLLAAKMLFLVVFLYAPLLLAQCVILAEAGFTPFSSFRGLLYGSLLLTCVLVLPLIALATVTKNFARMTLAVLGAAICLTAIVLLASNLPPDRVAIQYGREIAAFFVLCLCVAVVVLQYARRSVKVSWVLLALLPVVLFGASIMDGTPNNSVMDRNYPHSQRTVASAQLAYQGKEGAGPSAYVAQKRDRVGISIPVLVSGVADGTVTIPDFLKVTLQAPGGGRWTSVWQTYSDDKFFPGEKVVSARFTMPRAIYDNFLGKPLNLQVTFALMQAHAGNVEQITLGHDDFAVSGLGICTPITDFAERPDEIRALVCRAPLRHPELTLIRTAWHTAPCSCASPNPDDNMQAAAWIGSTERDQAEFGIVPVWSSAVDLTNQLVRFNPTVEEVRHLCPQTPIAFTKYTLTARTQASFSIDGFQLPHLNAGQLTVINHD
jgi:hypothetical protein